MKVENTSVSYNSETINSGANSVMELMDGKGESKLAFGFDISPVILNKISKSRDYVVKLQLWDAGTLWEPAIKLKNLRLDYFSSPFSEGDGYSFLAPEFKPGTSNWVYRDSINKWENTTITTSSNGVVALNRVNEDLNFNVTVDFKALLLYNQQNINFLLSVDNRENDNVNLYRKFIHSSYTKTVFKPYLEFIFDDTIIDNSYNSYANQTNKIYLINKSGNDFDSTPTVIISQTGQSNVGLTTVKESTSVYSLTIPSIPNNPTGKTIVTVKWFVAGNEIYKQNVELKNNYILNDEYDFSNLYFYPVTPSTHNIVKQGDILPYNVISEIRGDKTVVINTYEYRVTSMDGFEMIPWQPVNVYRDTMYFSINTEYFFPEQQYEVWVRNKTDNYTLTSNQTHKFKVAINDKSHMRDMSASPYYSRNQFFSK
ncbi:MAG: hypothetical protein ABIP51_03155 [Bacteroidia bacterium]